MYDVEKSKEMVKKFDDLIIKLFAYYAIQHPISIESSTLASNIDSQLNSDQGDEDKDWDCQFRKKKKKKQGDEQRNELERYFEDEVEDDNLGFDILTWLKMKAVKQVASIT